MLVVPDPRNMHTLLARSVGTTQWNEVNRMTGESRPIQADDVRLQNLDDVVQRATVELNKSSTGVISFDQLENVSEDALTLAYAHDIDLDPTDTRAFETQLMELLGQAQIAEDDRRIDESPHDPAALRAVFIAGSGASGKGFVGRQIFTARDGFHTVNADTHLERLLKKKGIAPKDVGKHYGLFTKARDLRHAELGVRASVRQGMVIDSTGWDYPRIANPKKALENLGYDTYMVVIMTTLETARKRNKDRGASGGREVPQSYIDDAHRGLMDNLGRYMRLFGAGRIFIIDNDDDLTPRQFQQIVGAKLKQIRKKIMNKPIKNPLGVKWLKNAYAQSADKVKKQQRYVTRSAGDQQDHTRAKPVSLSHYVPKPKAFGASLSQAQTSYSASANAFAGVKARKRAKVLPESQITEDDYPKVTKDDKRHIADMQKNRRIPSVADKGMAIIVRWADGRGLFAVRSKKAVADWYASSKSGEHPEIVSIKYGKAEHKGKPLRVSESASHLTVSLINGLTHTSYCPKCESTKVTHRERHADTSISYWENRCNACNHAGESATFTSDAVMYAEPTPAEAKAIALEQAQADGDTCAQMALVLGLDVDDLRVKWDKITQDSELSESVTNCHPNHNHTKAYEQAVAQAERYRASPPSYGEVAQRIKDVREVSNEQAYALSWYLHGQQLSASDALATL